MQQQGAFIDGKHITTQAQVEVIDPSTAEVFAITADCGPDEVDEAVHAAAAAAVHWRTVSVAERASILRRIGALILDNLDRLGNLEARQTGKPISQARRDTEITARYFDFYASAVEMLYGDTVPLNNDTLIYTRWEPHGVTAHVIPWNYPLQILGRSIAPSLAMGNGCVLKPAEEAPLTALVLAELAIEAGLPAGLFNVVPGYGESAGAALTRHPGIGHISFTGSVEVGKIISRAAAENVVPVTMELGGKSPNIVFADADLDRAVPVLVNAILQNAGQTCSAGARLLVQEGIQDELIERVRASFAKVHIGPALEDPALGPLISAQQRDRVLGYLDYARNSSVLSYGGSALSGGRFGNGYFIQPTLVTGVDPQDRLAQEEIFGPVLVTSSFRTVDEAVELANGTDYGLVAGVWTTNVSTAHRMVRDVIAGQVFVNTYGASGGVEIPFGGFKRSGHGREKGFEGLRGFGQLKTAVVAL